MSKIISTNPAKNYEPVGEVEFSSEDDIIAKVTAAQAAKQAWRQLGVTKRIKLLQPIIDAFTERRGEIAQLITAETGKSITESRNEFERYSMFAQWYLDHGEEALQDEIVYEDDTSVHKVAYEPWGVTAAIAPWNFPYGMGIWGIIPALVAGNTVIFKTSEECLLVGKLMEEIMADGQLPAGVFAEVYGDGEVGDFLTDQDINYIWFTGSTKTGQHLYTKAAAKFIRATLEMGGSSPGVVFEDVDPRQAADIMFAQRFRNCGQVCTSIKRLIVHESIMPQVVAELAAILKSKSVGDPAKEDVDMGSLVAKRQVDHLAAQVQDAIDKGAVVVAKLEIPDGLQGAYFAPTILTNITPDMRVWREEVFGPVLPIVSFATESEAIELANDTTYGLNARVMSRDMERAERVSAQIEAGMIKINDENSVSGFDPFGGYKLSGIGREHGLMGLRELCQVKSITYNK